MEKTKELFMQFINSGLTKSTVDGYMRDISQFFLYLRKKGIENIRGFDAAVITGYIEHLTAKGTSISSVRRKVSAINKLFKFMQKKDICDLNTIKKPQIPRQKKKEPPALGQKELSCLLKAPDINTQKGLRDKAMLELLCATGIKTTELIRLNVSDVLIGNSAVKCGIGDSVRIISINPSARKYLKKYLSLRQSLLTDRNEKSLFINMSGARLTRQGLSKILKGYADENGIKDKITPNNLRYNFAKKLAQKGLNVDSIKDILGHADIYTTKALIKTVKNSAPEDNKNEGQKTMGENI